jgi:hypothetical protein
VVQNGTQKVFNYTFFCFHPIENGKHAIALEPAIVLNEKKVIKPVKEWIEKGPPGFSLAGMV